MEHVRWALRPELHRPVAIAAFEGWNDAGDAATSAVRYLIDRWDLDPVAEIDPEEFYDFTSTRPEVRLDEDGHREIEWPATEVFAGPTPHAGDVIIVVGAEPQLRWRTYTRELTELVQDLGAHLGITVGALLAEVPHTRPTPVVGTAERPDLIPGFDLRRSTYEGPTGIVGVLHDSWRRAGLDAASLWGTVPSYVPGAPSPKAALALVERITALLRTSVVTTDLEIAAASYERQVTELVEADEETSTYVADLELRHDREPDPDQLPSAESIAEEVERFLREQ
ncbi:MAG: PAC2 family protein [Actinomycetota bacterium]